MNGVKRKTSENREKRKKVKDIEINDENVDTIFFESELKFDSTVRRMQVRKSVRSKLNNSWECFLVLRSTRCSTKWLWPRKNAPRSTILLKKSAKKWNRSLAEKFDRSVEKRNFFSVKLRFFRDFSAFEFTFMVGKVRDQNSFRIRATEKKFRIFAAEKHRKNRFVRRRKSSGEKFDCRWCFGRNSARMSRKESFP